MNIAHWFQDKWINRVRQFGLHAAFRQILLAIVRPVWQIRKNLVMAIPEHQPDKQPEHAEILDMTPHTVRNAVELGQLNERQQALLQSFLTTGCKGFFCQSDNHIAGYAFIQPAGTYVFAGSGRFQIPDGMMIFKNLLIFPQFRGHSLGKKLHQARIASIPADQTPIVFVMPENRFAIRNLKMYGFEEMLTITRITWFKKKTIQRIGKIKNCKITHHLIQGFRDTSKALQKNEIGKL